MVRAISRARQFLLDIQRPDGSWYGSWGCCFTYASWFGVEGLLQAGEPLDSPSLAAAQGFLLKHQNPNGGWGEDFTSCFDKTYAAEGMKLLGDAGSGVVCTGWALLALMASRQKRERRFTAKRRSDARQPAFSLGRWRWPALIRTFLLRPVFRQDQFIVRTFLDIKRNFGTDTRRRERESSSTSPGVPPP